ncbi:MAG: serine hydrolase [Methanosarcinales archaeon]|nr:serine hydrolase [Methanosarcinales archaeon]
MNKVRKIVTIILIAIVLLVVLPLTIASILYSPEYVQRCVFWGASDVYDYQKFPNRTVQAGYDPFFFRQGYAEDEARVSRLLQSALGIDDLDSALEASGTQAFIVIQNDTILYERYFNGARRDSIVTSFSVAKSFTSALVGIALAEGYIRSVNDPVTKYLPELAARDTRFSNITLRHLLMMSSGLQFTSEDYPIFVDDMFCDNALAYYHPNLRELALENTRIIEPPGQHFLYNNYNLQLIGMVLERATGQNVSYYLQEKIWKPIGMEFDGSWSLDSQESGFELMQAGINARAIDFAKFGRLYLKNGSWNDSQVIPAAWVAESTQEDRSIDRASYYLYDPNYEYYRIFKDNGYYGYFRWGLHKDDGKHDFLASGHLTQRIYISPQADLIIVRNGERDLPKDWEPALNPFISAMEKRGKNIQAQG